MVGSNFWILFSQSRGSEKIFKNYFMADKQESTAITEFCGYLIENYLSNDDE